MLDYSYRTDVHFSHPCFARTLYRYLLLRSYGINAGEARSLGKDNEDLEEVYESGRWPLLRQALKLRKGKHLILKYASGERTLRGFSNAYMQNEVALDQLPTGIGKREIEVCFLQLENHTQQNILDIDL